MAVSIRNPQKKVKLNLPRLRRSANKVMAYLGLKDREVSLLLTDDEGIREINRLYLNKNQPTNVISFAQQEGEFKEISPFLLGDIIISVETASREAELGGLTLDDELTYLFVHGLLHLIGYNHEDSSSAEEKRMFDKTKEILNYLKKPHINI